jgi:DNA mismatch repair protein MutL
VINRLAAGEVVERPASVLKEIMENALDAGAKVLDIHYRNGGLSFLSVADDGSGMDSSDLSLCALPHATSKLMDNDLATISTFGFRGEALAAIGAVSRLAITSRHSTEAHAWKVEVDAGEMRSPAPASLPRGTRVEVSDLFRAVPARLKFLKSEPAEAARLIDVVTSFALARPEVAFTLTTAKREIFRLKADSREQRIATLLGDDFAANMIAVGADGDVGVMGYIRLPEAKARGDRQFLFVNGRMVSDRMVAAAIRSGVLQATGRDLTPEFVLFLTVPGTMVDVNAHPAKAEVRFAAPQVVRRVVTEAVQSGFVQAGFGAAARLAEQVQAAAAANPMTMEQRRPLGDVLGQAHNAFIITATADGIAIIDQHAAHERILLERLKAQGVESRPRPLPVPIVVSLSPTQAADLCTVADELASLGLHIEPFGYGAVAVRSLPDVLGVIEVHDLIPELAFAVAEAGAADGLKAEIAEVLAHVACRHAIKAGEALDGEAMEKLLRALEVTPNGVRCNHGRPAVAFLALNDLRKLFDR